MIPISKQFRSFVERHPALAFGLMAMLSIAAALLSCPWLLSLFLFTFFLYPIKRALPILLLAGALFYAVERQFPYPDISKEGLKGYARLSIEQLSRQQTKTGFKYIYKGKISGFWRKDDLQFVPSLAGTQFYLPFLETVQPRPIADADYLILCDVKPISGRWMLIDKAASSEWKRLNTSFKLAEKRFHAKEWVNDFIKSRFHSPPVRSFLSGIITGSFDDKELFASFQQLGLIHLLAISGFHFSLLAALLSTLLKPLPDQWRSSLVAFILSVYFLFLGWGPSVLRAWMTILLFYGSSLFERFSNPLNALGTALLLSLLMDPLLLLNIGFQFSFLTTAAILVLNAPCLALINRFFPLRPFKEASSLSLTAQHAYIFLRFTASNLSLGLATTIPALPLSLIHFGFFPPASLLYNLFFPAMTGLSMSLLLAGIVATPIEPLARLLHLTNDYFTSFLLNLASES
jgi:competence protein ComEC